MKNIKKLVELIACVLVAFCWTACSDNYSVISQKITLNENWKLQSSTKVGVDGKLLSEQKNDAQEWYVATVPSTVMGVLSNNGLYKDLLQGVNYKNADKTIFDSSWWYKKDFTLTTDQLGKHISLNFDGISFRANIWLNGQQIASKEETYGAFKRFEFDVSHLVKENNTLAVEVIRAQQHEPNIGFVDWNPRPLDESMGIFREVYLTVEGTVGLRNTWVKSDVNIETLAEAALTIQTDITNYSDTSLSGTLYGKIGDIKFSYPISLKANEKRQVKLTKDEILDLNIKNPKLWWSVGFGSPDLYNLELNFVVDNKISAQENVEFGIRDVKSYWTDGGYQGIMLNGKKVLVKGAGWTDDLFLRDTPESNEIQVKYVKDMNLNTIRFENVWGTSKNVYELCDRYGLLVIVGWSCQWEWEGYMGIPDDRYGCIHSEHDMNLVADYWRHQLTWLRNHPSIMVWMSGSDKIPKPELERRYLEIKKEVNDKTLYIAASQMEDSEVSGKTGMKMFGPYEYVGPNYWFVDKKYGGAYGFNTETGPGAQLPVLESIQKMLPKTELWPLNAEWDYHCTASTSALNTMKTTTEVVDGMFGKANNLKEYLDRSHLASYQSTRSMFEAFRVNKSVSTGIVQWMLNSAWPSLYWQLYDYYQVPVPAYYGVRQGNLPIQLIYNYEDNGIYLVNETLNKLSNAKAEIRAYDTKSKLLYEYTLPANIDANSVLKLQEIDNSNLNTILFLQIVDNDGADLARNTYVLSSVADEYFWDKSNWVGTPIKSYGDFKALTSMPKVDLNVKVEKHDGTLVVQLENNSKSIAFFTQLLLKDVDKQVVTSVFWEDNYISLQPGEKRSLKCNISQTKSSVSSLKISGWNIEELNIEF